MVTLWNPLGDCSMRGGTGARPTSDRKPNGWVHDVLAIKEGHASCGDLALLQRSVVQGVETVRALVVPEFAASRKKEIAGRGYADEVWNPDCVPARRSSGSSGRPIPGVLSS